MKQGIFPRAILVLYLVLLMLPVYWLINMSLRTNEDIMSRLAFFPHHLTFAKYAYILSSAFRNSGSKAESLEESI